MRTKFADVAGLNDAEWRACKSAARMAAPIFAANGWEYTTHNPDDRTETEVPDVFRIAEMLVHLVKSAKSNESGGSGSGRFSVQIVTDHYPWESETSVSIALELVDESVASESFDGSPNPVWVEQERATQEAGVSA